MSPEKFWSKVNKTEGCWIWTAAANGPTENSRYGTLYFEDRIQKAHRVSWQLTQGLIPNGLYVLHRCDTPLCVRPAHLFLGTLKENSIDAYKKGRLSLERAARARTAQQRAQTLCKNGHSLSGGNLYLTADGTRSCRICRRANRKRYNARHGLTVNHYFGA